MAPAYSHISPGIHTGHTLLWRRNCCGVRPVCFLLSTIKMAIPECEGEEDFLTPPIFYGVHIPSWSVVGMRLVRGLKKKKRAADDED